MPPPTLQTCRPYMESLGEVNPYLLWPASNSMHIVTKYWTGAVFTILVYENKIVLDELNNLKTFVRCEIYSRYTNRTCYFEEMHISRAVELISNKSRFVIQMLVFRVETYKNIAIALVWISLLIYLVTTMRREQVNLSGIILYGGDFQRYLRALTAG